MVDEVKGVFFLAVHIVVKRWHDTVRFASANEHWSIGIFCEHRANICGHWLHCCSSFSAGRNVNTGDYNSWKFPRGNTRGIGTEFVSSPVVQTVRWFLTPPFVDKDSNFTTSVLPQLAGPVSLPDRKVSDTDLIV